MEILHALPDHWRLSRDIRLRALAEAPDAFCSTLEGEQGLDEAGWLSRLERAHGVRVGGRCDSGHGMKAPTR